MEIELELGLEWELELVSLQWMSLAGVGMVAVRVKECDRI